METNRLKQFVTVAELGNLRKAAQLLGLTHSALSKSLKVLEVELGLVLFMREGRGIVLSDQGHEYLPRALKFLQSYDEMLKGPVEEKSLKIGTFEVFSTHFFSGPLLQELKGLPDFQDMSISLQELLPGALEKALLDGNIDMGISYETVPTAGLDILKVGTCEMAVFGQKGRFAKESFYDIPFAAPTQRLPFVPSSIKGLDGWPDDKIKRKIKYRVDMLESALQLAASGECLGFFPRFVVAGFNKKVKPEFALSEYKFEGIKNLNKKILRNIYLIKRQSTLESSEFKKIAKVLRHIGLAESK